MAGPVQLAGSLSTPRGCDIAFYDFFFFKKHAAAQSPGRDMTGELSSKEEPPQGSQVFGEAARLGCGLTPLRNSFPCFS